MSQNNKEPTPWVDNPLIHTILADSGSLKYDAAIKKILSYLPITAQIIQDVVPEFSDMSIEEIAECIDAVQPSSKKIRKSPKRPITRQVASMNTEDSSVTHDKILYDLKIMIRNPKSEKNDCLIINLEAQNVALESKLGYPIETRALYYACRLISNQKHEVFDHSDFGNIEKVYSIWLIESPNEANQNSMVAYNLQENVRLNNPDISAEKIDLIRVVFVFLGGDVQSSILPSVKILNTIIDPAISGEEKIQSLGEMGIPIDSSFREGVLEMCNFSAGIALKAEQNGRDGYASDLRNLRMYLKSIGKHDDAERAADKPECFAELWEKYKDKI